MKPESMRNGPSVPRTSWVWAWPPNRSADSKSVTSWVADRTWAAVRPDTPAPTTAAVGRDGPWIERGTEASCMSCGPGWFGTTLRPDWRVSAARRVMPGTLSILRPHRMVVVEGVSKVWRGYGDRAIGDGRPAGRSRVRLPQRLHDDDRVGPRNRSHRARLGRRRRRHPLPQHVLVPRPADPARLPRHRTGSGAAFRAARGEPHCRRARHDDLRRPERQHDGHVPGRLRVQGHRATC